VKALIQRVAEGRVMVEEKIVARISRGLVVLLGVAKKDTPHDADQLADRILRFRIFEDETGKMSRSVREVGGQILVVSQFTLVANLEKGNRPSFDNAAGHEAAERLYGIFVNRLAVSGLAVETGRFGARMVVSLHNDGPVTFMLECPLS
jgi:D-tyrosyl-tRNA(Tyr) deacylase